MTIYEILFFLQTIVPGFKTGQKEQKVSINIAVKISIE
jgi:hypothetical protein